MSILLRSLSDSVTSAVVVLGCSLPDDLRSNELLPTKNIINFNIINCEGYEIYAQKISSTLGVEV